MLYFDLNDIYNGNMVMIVVVVVTMVVIVVAEVTMVVILVFEYEIFAIFDLIAILVDIKRETRKFDGVYYLRLTGMT